MLKFDKLCKEVADKLGEDYELVRNICMFQFKFIREVMQDDGDIHDILIHNLFRFKLKSRFKENKQKEYSSK